MAQRKILITGGAGFIGSHLADALLAAGHRVRALDCLHPQVHGDERRRPGYLAAEVELQLGDVRDPEAVRRALDGVDAVFHFAARVGVGQSMYEVEPYMDSNARGTAVLMQELMRSPVRRLIVASSMSIYGEGLYRCDQGQRHDVQRRLEDLKQHVWEPHHEGVPFMPLATPESKRPNLSSVYALSKHDQERLCLLLGEAYRIPTLALRFFNVYGTRQALSNPYTGVLAIFASRLLNGKRPNVFEDGKQRRDFVHVSDVVRACLLALDSAASGLAINVGSGISHTVVDVARAMAEAAGRPEIAPELNGSYRVGDIRHCYADISLAQRALGYRPSTRLADGLRELATWLRTQIAVDRVDEARAQLTARGLTL
jgi:dTDP-L-rhamnose 4-epimerase